MPGLTWCCGIVNPRGNMLY